MATTEKGKEVSVVQEPARHHWMSQWLPQWVGARRNRSNLDIFDEMDRMFDRMMANPFRAGALRPLAGIETSMPRVDVIDRDKEVVLRAELPGVNKDDIEVSMTDHSVTLRGKYKHEEKQEEGDYYFCETSSGEFSRTVPLPTEVDGTKAKAVYKDGMIELTLPKLEAAQRRKIDIQTG